MLDLLVCVVWTKYSSSVIHIIVTQQHEVIVWH